MKEKGMQGINVMLLGSGALKWQPNDSRSWQTLARTSRCNYHAMHRVVEMNTWYKYFFGGKRTLITWAPTPAATIAAIVLMLKRL